MRIFSTLVVLFAVLTIHHSLGQLCKTTCTTKFKTLGCYKDEEVPNRRLPHYIMNDRDSSIDNFSGKLIDWYNWNSYMQDFACRCAHKAASLGYDLFGLQFYGECWAGKSSEGRKPKNSDKSSQCIQDDYKPCTRYRRYCIGHQWTNMVYELIPPCEIEFETVGCYRDQHTKGSRPLPRYALTDRDPWHRVTSHKTIDWINWDVYVPEFACRCARKAQKEDSHFFGLQFYGECWTGETADKGLKYAKDGESHICVNNCYQHCKSHDKYCVGEHHANYVYAIKDKCEVEVQEKGCFRNLPSDLQEIRNEINPASPVFGANVLNEYNWIEKFSRFLCRCARKVKAKGWKYIGINRAGACYSGATSDRYIIQEQRNQCYQKNGTLCTAGDKMCAGWDAQTNFVYEIKA